MTNEEAIKKMQAVKAYMISGNPIWSVTEMGEAFDMAIESLENNGKLAEDLQNCLEMYKKKKAEVESLKQTQIVRCKDCKYRGKMVCPFGIRQMPRDNDFCFYGKRRGEEE